MRFGQLAAVRAFGQLRHSQVLVAAAIAPAVARYFALRYGTHETNAPYWLITNIVVMRCGRCSQRQPNPLIMSIVVAEQLVQHGETIIDMFRLTVAGIVVEVSAALGA
jgi:hypothetical protein